MGYKINIEGLEVICETAADVLALARMSKPKPATEVEVPKAANRNGNVPQKNLRAVIDQLNPKAKDMLKAVVNAPGSKTPAGELVHSLRLGSGSALGGTRGSLSKHFKSYGYDPDAYLDVTGGPGDKTYSIPQDKVAEVRSALRL